MSVLDSQAEQLHESHHRQRVICHEENIRSLTLQSRFNNNNGPGVSGGEPPALGVNLVCVLDPVTAIMKFAAQWIYASSIFDCDLHRARTTFKQR